MEQTLLLNATYEPLKVVNWQKAITLLCQGKVEVISVYDREIRAVSFSIKLPSVIRLLRYIKIKRRFDYVPFSRANIYARDNHSCQYCGDVFPTSELTFDHVVPVAQGGRKDWENIVTCCVSCNRRKGGRTPVEAGMHLVKYPKRPESVPAIRITIGLRNAPDSWRDFLYWNAELDETVTRLTSIQPHWAVEGGRVTIHGSGFPIDRPHLPDVTFGETPARAVFASPSTISVLVPQGLDGGQTAVRVEGVPGETALLEVGTQLATGLHQVDNPVFDRAGNLYVTYSGTRGQEVPVSIFRVSPTGRRESYVSGIVNPTSMTFDASGQLYVSSRFEGSVYRVFPNGTHEPYASDLGIACGLAFDRTECSTSAIAPGRSSLCSRIGRSPRSRRCRRASPHFILRSGPRVPLRVGADAWSLRSRVSTGSRHRRDRSRVFGFRPSAGNRVRLAGRAVCR